jgi:hypothetical protein
MTAQLVTITTQVDGATCEAKHAQSSDEGEGQAQCCAGGPLQELPTRASLSVNHSSPGLLL